MVTHKKTGQKLTKIDRSKRKGNGASKSVAKSDTNGAAPPKPRQQMIPGTEPKHYAELGGLAEELADAKDRVKTAVGLRKTREGALIAGMRKRGVTHYVDRGLNIEMILETPDRVKVKKYNHEDENDE